MELCARASTWLRWGARLFVLAGVGACGGAGEADSGAAAGSPGEPLELRVQVVRDGERESHRVLVPGGWVVEGGAWWAPAHLSNVPPSRELRVSGPGGWSVEVGPTRVASDFEPSAFARIQLGARRAAEGSVDDGLPVEYLPHDPQGWETWIAEKEVRRRRPGASELVVEGIALVPELTEVLGRRLAPLRAQAEQRNRQALAEGEKQESFAEGAVIAASLRYREAEREWEELVLFGAVYSGFTNQMGRQVEWAVDPCLALRAPLGELDGALALLFAIATSVRPTAQWQEHVARSAPKSNPLAALAAAEGVGLLVEGRGLLGQSVDATAADSAARTLRRLADGLRGCARFRLPEFEGEVLLPLGHGPISSGGQGSYWLGDRGRGARQQVLVPLAD